MEKDISWSVYFENDERFADFVNACGCRGKQFFSPGDIKTLDSKNTYRGRKRKKKTIKYRDVVRKAAMGINFAIIGLENQEYVNYAMPLTCMCYDAGEYEKQKNAISRIIRDKKLYRGKGEFLYSFLKESRLYPVITFVLYSGEDWDGPKELSDIVDFTGMPDSLVELVQNYKVNLIDIRKWSDTSVFKTDIRQVFDCIRYSEDKEQLKRMVENDPEYSEMSMDTVDVIQKYANIELKNVEQYIVQEGEKVNMCKAMQDWAADERAKGKEEGREEIIARGLQNGVTPEQLVGYFGISMDEVLEVQKLMQQNNEPYNV